MPRSFFDRTEILSGLEHEHDSLSVGQAEAQHMFATNEIDCHGYVRGPAGDPSVCPDLHHDRIQLQDRLHIIEGAGLPGPQLRQHHVGDLGDQLG